MFYQLQIVSLILIIRDVSSQTIFPDPCIGSSVDACNNMPFGQYPDCNDCRKYVICLMDFRLDVQCQQDGTAYNPDTGHCQLNSAGCGGNTHGVSTSIPAMLGSTPEHTSSTTTTSTTTAAVRSITTAMNTMITTATALTTASSITTTSLTTTTAATTTTNPTTTMIPAFQIPLAASPNRVASSTTFPTQFHSTITNSFPATPSTTTSIPTLQLLRLVFASIIATSTTTTTTTTTTTSTTSTSTPTTLTTTTTPLTSVTSTSSRPFSVANTNSTTNTGFINPFRGNVVNRRLFPQNSSTSATPTMRLPTTSEAVFVFFSANQFGLPVFGPPISPETTTTIPNTTMNSVSQTDRFAGGFIGAAPASFTTSTSPPVAPRVLPVFPQTTSRYVHTDTGVKLVKHNPPTVYSDQCLGIFSTCLLLPDGLYPSCSTCSTLVICSGGVKRERWCPFGMLYDRYRGLCRPWQFVRCFGFE